MKPEQKEEFKRNMGELFKELKSKLNLKRIPKVLLVDDKDNAKKMLGGTGSYDKESNTIRLYITDRHPKDILRTFAHEVIHHWQNEHGKLETENKDADPNYAQNDPVLRRAEKQAYLLGNICCRDWEDNKKYKEKTQTLSERKLHSKKIISEGPEIMFDRKWYDASCVGPFIIFKLNGEYHYAMDVREEGVYGTVYFDDGSSIKIDDDEGKGPVHQLIQHVIEKKYPDYRIKNYRIKNGVVDGRLWLINGKAYIGLWRDIKQLQGENKHKISSILKTIAQEYAGVQLLDDIFVEPWSSGEHEGDRVKYPFREFRKLLFSGESEETDLVKQKLMKKLHMMDANQKSQFLKQLGAQIKVSDMPDWQKRSLLGIDEKYE